MVGGFGQVDSRDGSDVFSEHTHGSISLKDKIKSVLFYQFFPTCVSYNFHFTTTTQFNFHTYYN